MIVDGTPRDGGAVQSGDRLLDHARPGRQPAARRASCRLHVSAPSVRAGIVVTGTEVLTGRVSDRNGPWLAERLRELGVDLAYMTIVGDRPEDMRAALEFMAAQRRRPDRHERRPRADRRRPDGRGRRGASRGARWCSTRRSRSASRRSCGRWRTLAEPRRRRSRRPTASRPTIPRGATVLEPVGTAPGLVVPPARGAPSAHGPTVVVLPGPPRELQPMWSAGARDATRCARRSRGATVYRQRTLRLFGIPESEIAETLRVAERDGRAARAARDHDLPETRRGRDRDALRARRRRTPTTPSWRSSRSATPTRCSRATAAPSTSRSRRC